jgi:hypothetical protein
MYRKEASLARIMETIWSSVFLLTLTFFALSRVFFFPSQLDFVLKGIHKHNIFFWLFFIFFNEWTKNNRKKLREKGAAEKKPKKLVKIVFVCHRNWKTI